MAKKAPACWPFQRVSISFFGVPVVVQPATARQSAAISPVVVLVRKFIVIVPEPHEWEVPASVCLQPWRSLSRDCFTAKSRCKKRTGAHPRAKLLWVTSAQRAPPTSVPCSACRDRCRSIAARHQASAIPPVKSVACGGPSRKLQLSSANLRFHACATKIAGL